MKRLFIIIVAVSILNASCQQDGDGPSALKYYGDANEDIGSSIAEVDDGYIIAGQLTDIVRNGNRILSSDRNMGIIKTGMDGNVIWKLSSGGKFDDMGAKVITASDGSIICVGTYTDDASLTPGHTDIYAVKVSPQGDIVWQQRYGGSGNQKGIDILPAGGGFMILGSTDIERLPVSDSTGNRAGKLDIFLVRISADGNAIESFYYGYPGNDRGAALKQEPGGGFAILGTTDRSDPGQGGNNLIIIRLNADGNAVESTIIGGTGDENAADLEILDDGYFIAGTVGKNEEEQSIFLTRLGWDIFDLPFEGFPKEIKAAGSASSASAISVNTYGNIVIAGQSIVKGAPDILVLEVDQEGNEIAGHTIIKGSTGSQYASDVLSDEEGSIAVVGNNRLESNSLITFLKFRF